MKISQRQLRRIIREALMTEGYSVPEFPNSASMEDWVDELVDSDPEAEVDYDVMDPETGEVLIPAGESASEQQWYVAPEPEGPTPEELAAAEEEAEWDWDAYEREQEAKEEKQRADDDRIQDMVTQQAVDAGEDWARDTLYQAKSSPNMWQNSGGMNQYDSAEDYVSGFGQDAAADMADSFLTYAMDREVAVEYIDMPASIRDQFQYRTCAKIDKIRNAGYSKPITSLEEAITDYIQNYLYSNKRLS